MLSLAQRELQLEHYLIEHNKYSMCKYDEWNYNILKKCNTVYNRKGNHVHYVNEVIIMADTETSKNPDHKTEVYENHLVAWTISIRAANTNLVTLYGTGPESSILTIEKIHNYLRGNQTIIYYHNLSYDWVFLRRFYMEHFGIPERQLNTKSHYPISINFENGIILRDSLILAQRGLEKWANDMNVPHKKAVNEWDYNKIRVQGGDFTHDELEYIEHDTLAGVECLDAMRKQLHKTVASMPYTATGIVREEFRKTAKKNRGREWFLKQYLDYDLVGLSEHVYHGGYTHQNRFLKGTVIDSVYTGGEPVRCWDLASSYPFALISEKYPQEKFTSYPDCKPESILSAAENYGFMFHLEAYNIKLKDPLTPMPYLQYSKSRSINELTDNGRIIEADYIDIPITEIDLKIISSQYTWDEEYTECTSVVFAHKDYLPRWFTDFVFKLFEDKTTLKGGDPVLYALSKAKLNSCYGMCCQHVMQDDIREDYISGEYSTIENQDEETYEKYVENYNTFLPYQIGIWCTTYACKNLFELGACVSKNGEWIYSDTDSCFGYGWDDEKLNEYNQKRIDLMRERGYHGVEHKGRMYHLGIAELDKVCTEFVGIHSKCYAYTDENKELHITVAGVPKKTGAKCLNGDIHNFKVGLIFPGTQTGKLTHTYIFNNIHKDKYGNLIGDSIDLSPCDYLINDVNTIKWEDLITDDIEIMRNYDDE